jgi:hypothetical protein
MNADDVGKVKLDRMATYYVHTDLISISDVIGGRAYKGMHNTDYESPSKIHPLDCEAQQSHVPHPPRCVGIRRSHQDKEACRFARSDSDAEDSDAEDSGTEHYPGRTTL